MIQERFRANITSPVSLPLSWLPDPAFRGALAIWSCGLVTQYSALGFCVCVGRALALVTTRLQPSGDPDPAGLWHGVGWLCLILQACKAKLLWLPDCVL